MSGSIPMDYGGLGDVMATFFWIGFGLSIIVLAASIAPALPNGESPAVAPLHEGRKS